MAMRFPGHLWRRGALVGRRQGRAAPPRLWAEKEGEAERELTLAERIALELDIPSTDVETGAGTGVGDGGAGARGEQGSGVDLEERLFGDDERPIILFDGVCVFCDTSVQFIMENEAPEGPTFPRDGESRRGMFRYTTQQSDIGMEIMAHCEPLLENVESASSIIVYEKGGVYARSDAVLRIISRMRFPWSLFQIAAVLSPSLRDRLYNFVSENRHMFGEKESCILPDDESVADRFL